MLKKNVAQLLTVAVTNARLVNFVRVFFYFFVERELGSGFGLNF